MSKRTPKTYRTEAVVELPAGLLLGGEFLGVAKPARIDGVEVHVVMPDFRYSETGPLFETVLPRRTARDWVSELAEQDPEEEREWPFASPSRWEDEDVTEFYAAAPSSVKAPYSDN